MDLVSACKEKLACLRVKELKDVLSQLGLSKQGNKQNLVDRILAMLSDGPGSKMSVCAIGNPFTKDEVAKLIEDTYRKMYGCEATDLESIGRSGSVMNTEMLQEDYDNSFQLDAKIRCPCESPLLIASMVQCQDCHVLQHTGCVIIVEEPVEGLPPVPTQFFCETCRINRADPFLVTVAYLLHPVKLTTNAQVSGETPLQSVEKLFHLTRADRELLQKPEYDVQVWCILLNDRVPFRMHWPQYAGLQVNGLAVRAINRPGSQLLGANGRDNGPIITACISDGLNRISLTGRDARIFCLGVRILKRRTIQQVLNLIPKELDSEQFEDALARVCRCFGGGAENADSDSDLEVVADSVTVNLRCPMSGSRIKIASRFKPCTHMGCFDLETFVELNQHSRKWQCPICLTNYSLEDIIVDPYFNRITTMMRSCGEDVTEIEVKPDGCWRAKNRNESMDLAQWHSPDGTLSVAIDEANLNIGILNQFKQESVSDRHTRSKLGTNMNCNVSCISDTAEDTFTLCSESILQDKFGEDSSVNQESGGLFYSSANTGIELDSASMNFDPTCGDAFKDPSALVGDAKIIVLSDSEDENGNLISPRTVCETGHANASWTNSYVPHLGVSDSYPEARGLTTNESPCLSLLNGNDNGSYLIMSNWPTSGALAGSGPPLYGSEVNVSDSSVTCLSLLNGYSVIPEMQNGCPTRIPDPSHCSNSDISNKLVDASLPYWGDAPSLQNFLPSRPDGTVEQSDLRGQPGISNGLHNEEYISLCLDGGSCDGDLGYSAADNGLNLRNRLASMEGTMDSAANTASFVSYVNNEV
ncbi:hypothetical protein L1049_007751 [Liquidambar formosana]|uniref:E3 SUMO-protein ligase SIZ1 n=1 Tax=Liquidambar formosana TaxID=63359 RepID=A0AAP0S8M1_LIQFO